MSEHTTQTVKAQIQSLINLANETTGNTDTNLTDGVNALVSGYGQGGSGGTLEGGYNIMFYDENNEGLAFYSIKEGYDINPPLYTCNSWKTVDGTEIQFPYTPTSDLSVYANINAFASQLYDFYDVDKETYPYLCLRVHWYNANTLTTNLRFWKTVTANTKDTITFSGGLGANSGISATQGSLDLSNIETVLQLVMQNITSVSFKNDETTSPSSSFAYTFYTNFELLYEGSGNNVATKYRLD